jgi:hypothetical protein
MSPELLRRLRNDTRRRALVDAAFDAYVQWRNECNAVDTAYRRWVGPGTSEKACAFGAYNEALNREEHAAERYARKISRLTQMSDAALSCQPTPSEVS